MSLASVLALYRTALATGPFNTSLELSSDHRDDLDTIPAGGLRYQLRPDYMGQTILANTMRDVWRIEVTIARKLGTSEAERTYTENATSGMVAQQAALLARAFWLVAGVHSLDPENDRELEPSERVGRVVRFTAKATIVLAT